MGNIILDSEGNELVVDRFYIVDRKNLQYKGKENGILRFQKNSRSEMVTIDPDGKEFVFSYKQGFEPNYRSIQQGDEDTDYDEDLVEYGGKRRRTRRNKSRKQRKSRRNKSKIRKSRKHKKTKSRRQ